MNLKFIPILCGHSQFWSYLGFYLYMRTQIHRQIHACLNRCNTDKVHTVCLIYVESSVVMLGFKDIDAYVCHMCLIPDFSTGRDRLFDCETVCLCVV